MLAFSNDYYGIIFRATQSVELFCAYRDVIEGKEDIDGAYARFEATGKSGNNYNKIRDFRTLMTSDEFRTALKAEAVGNNTILFELKKIKREIDKMVRELDG